MNILDIIIILFFLYELIVGFCKGFVSSVFKLGGFILAIVLTKRYYSKVAVLISKNTKVFEAINRFATEKANALLAKISNPNNVNNILENMKLPSQVKEAIANNSGGIGQEAIDPSYMLSSVFTNLIINILSILLVFIIIKLIIYIIYEIIERFVEIPGIKQLNKILGMLLGLAKGILIVSFIFVIFSPIISFTPDGFISKLTEGSKLASFFYSNNVILYIIDDLHIGKFVSYLS